MGIGIEAGRVSIGGGKCRGHRSFGQAPGFFEHRAHGIHVKVAVIPRCEDFLELQNLKQVELKIADIALVMGQRWLPLAVDSPARQTIYLIEMTPATQIRLAVPEDAGVAARMLHDFNSEFESWTPPAEEIAERLHPLLARGAIRLLLAGTDPDGLALLSFRDTIWHEGPAALLEELYVVPDRRGQGIGRALMEAVLELAQQAGSAWIEVTTGESDREARRLYESLGFTNIEDSSDRPRMLYYELPLGPEVTRPQG